MVTRRPLLGLDQEPRVVRHRPLIAGQMGCEGADHQGEALAFAAQVGEAEGEEAAYRVVQLVGRGVEFGAEELEALLRLAEVPQGTGELDRGAAPAVAAEAAGQRLPVQRYGLVRVARRVPGACLLERSEGLAAGSSATSASITTRKSAACPSS